MMHRIGRRQFLAAATLTALAGRRAFAQPHRPARLFVGTYTTRSSQGIYAYSLDEATGILTSGGLAAATPSPSFLALAPGPRVLLAANEIDSYQGGKDGSLSTFRIDPATHKLVPINTVSSGGAGPCNVTFNHTGSAAFSANYDAGSSASFRVSPAGVISNAVSNPRYLGHGPNSERQEAPHAHCVTVTRNNRFLLVNDLGLDQIHIYGIDRSTALLNLASPAFWQAAPGSGPRALVFHPTGRWAYCGNELSNSIDVLAWDPAHASLQTLQSISTLPADFKSPNTVATVALDSSGKFLYVSNRGHDSIAAFSVHPDSGNLTLAGHFPCGGKTPRHFSISPSGKWMVTANQTSGNLAVLERNPSTGMLTLTANSYPLDQPVCALFA